MNKEQRVQLYNQIMSDLSKIVKTHLDEAFNMYNAGLSYGSRDDIDLLNINNGAYDGNDYGDNSDDNDYKQYLKRKNDILKYTDKLADKDKDGTYYNNINIDRFNKQTKSVLKKYPFLIDSKYINKIKDIEWLRDYMRLSRITRKYSNGLTFLIYFGVGYKKISGKKYLWNIERRIFDIYGVIDMFIEEFKELDSIDVRKEYENFLEELSHFGQIRATVTRNSYNYERILYCFNETYCATHDTERKFFWDYPSDFFIIKDINTFAKYWVRIIG